jgi:ArsR family transcriptional regulator, arsenate/arsenite/antimonite-responsive transcriptional repressor
MEFETLSECFKALGDKTRLRILALLKVRELCVCELTALLGMSQPAVSQHMRRLRSAKLVKERRQGQWVYYSLNPSAWPFLPAVLDALPNVENEIHSLNSPCDTTGEEA